MIAKLVIVFSVIILGFCSSALAITFKDMLQNHWAADSVRKVVDMGIMTGFPDGTFRGTKTMNRYELALFLNKLSDVFDKKIEELTAKVDSIELVKSGNSKNAERILTELREEINTMKIEIESLKSEIDRLKR